MAHAIKYQSTSIEVSRTISEIAELVRAHGGASFQQIWSDDGELLGIRFTLRTNTWKTLPLRFSVDTTDIELHLIEETKMYQRRDPEDRARMCKMQAERIAWRLMKDRIVQAFRNDEIGLQSLEVILMAHIEVENPQGEVVTMAQLLEGQGRLREDKRAIRLLA